MTDRVVRNVATRKKLTSMIKEKENEEENLGWGCLMLWTRGALLMDRVAARLPGHARQWRVNMNKKNYIKSNKSRMECFRIGTRT